MKRTYEQFSSPPPPQQQQQSGDGVFVSHSYHNNQQHQQQQQQQNSKGYHLQQHQSYHYNNSNHHYQQQHQHYSHSSAATAAASLSDEHHNHHQYQQQQSHSHSHSNHNTHQQDHDIRIHQQQRWHVNENPYEHQLQHIPSHKSSSSTVKKVSIVQTARHGGGAGPPPPAATTGRIILPSFKNFMDSIDKSVENVISSTSSSSSPPTATATVSTVILENNNNKKRKLSVGDNTSQNHHSQPDVQINEQQGSVGAPTVLYPPAPVTQTAPVSPNHQHHRLYITQTPSGNSSGFIGSVVSQPEPSLSSSSKADPYAYHNNNHHHHHQKNQEKSPHDMYSHITTRDSTPGYTIPQHYTQQIPYDQVRRSSVNYGSLQVSPPPASSSFYSSSLDPMLMHHHQPVISQQTQTHYSHPSTTGVMYPPQPPTSSVQPMMYPHHAPHLSQNGTNVQNTGASGVVTTTTRRESMSPQSRSNSPNSPPSSPDTTFNGNNSSSDLLSDDSNYQQLQPIRILAYRIGLSKDPNKSWRYRDIKRSLFEKTTPQHASFIEKNLEHSLLKQRLPHKLSMCSFAKRIMLLVFHFILRDGREPKFWRRSSVKTDLVEKILQENDMEFYSKINKQTAIEVHAYTAAGMSIEQAIHQHQLQQNQPSIPTESCTTSTGPQHQQQQQQHQQAEPVQVDSNNTTDEIIKSM